MQKTVFGEGKARLASEKKLSVLVVDDDPVIRQIHKMLLNKLGIIKIEAVKNGEEAVHLCSAGAVFDLVLMDMEMPVMDGPQATKKLRRMGVESMIVGVTSRGSDSEREAFMGAGLNDCYVKPLTIDKLKSLLQHLTNTTN